MLGIMDGLNKKGDHTGNGAMTLVIGVEKACKNYVMTLRTEKTGENCGHQRQTPTGAEHTVMGEDDG